MKRWLIVVLVVVSVLFASTASAQQRYYVVSDSYPSTAIQPDGFLVGMDGGTVVESPAESTAQGVRLKYEITSLVAGPHTMRVRAYKNNAAPFPRTVSDEAVFTFAKPSLTAPALPGGFAIISE